MRRNPPSFVAQLSLLSRLPSLSLAVIGALASGCSAGKESTVETCNVGSDCASGVCTSQGICAAVPDAATDTGASVDSAVPDVTASDAPSDAKPDAPASDVPSTSCVPNGDFVITPLELPLAPGLKATYRVATSVTIDVTGAAQPDGTRKWDFAKALSGDTNVLLETSSPVGTWWASSFPTATYAVPLSSTTNLLGVFKLDAAALSLLGVVSPTDTPLTSKTNIAYGTPVPVTKFNLAMGSKWTATSQVTGTYQGVSPYVYTEKYDVSVDAKGQLTTPYGAFPVLRVSTLLTKTIGLVVTYTRTAGYMAECFGTVASAVTSAATSDPGAEFTSAAEVRRLSP